MLAIILQYSIVTPDKKYLKTLKQQTLLKLIFVSFSKPLATTVDVQNELASEVDRIVEPGTMAQVIQKMTDNIIKVIDVKDSNCLGSNSRPFSRTTGCKYVVKVEGRIVTMETSATSMDTKIKALEEKSTLKNIYIDIGLLQ